MSLLHHFILTYWVNLEMVRGSRNVPWGAVFVITYSLKDTKALDFKEFIRNSNKIQPGFPSISLNERTAGYYMMQLMKIWQFERGSCLQKVHLLISTWFSTLMMKLIKNTTLETKRMKPVIYSGVDLYLLSMLYH